MRRLDIANNVYGKLTVVSFSHSNKQGCYWDCLCECGNTCAVSAKHLTRQNTTSCGCLQKERAKEYRSIGYGENVRNVLYSEYRYRAKRHNLVFELTLEQLTNIITKDCFYCGEKPKYRTVKNGNGGFYKNGIDRIDNNIGYIFSNCVPCCYSCNTMKMDSTYKDFIKRCISIAERHKNGI